MIWRKKTNNVSRAERRRVLKEGRKPFFKRIIGKRKLGLIGLALLAAIGFGVVKVYSKFVKEKEKPVPVRELPLEKPEKSLFKVERFSFTRNFSSEEIEETKALADIASTLLFSNDPELKDKLSGRRVSLMFANGLEQLEAEDPIAAKTLKDTGADSATVFIGTKEHFTQIVIFNLAARKNRGEFIASFVHEVGGHLPFQEQVVMAATIGGRVVRAKEEVKAFQYSVSKLSEIIEDMKRRKEKFQVSDSLYDETIQQLEGALQEEMRLRDKWIGILGNMQNEREK